MNQQKPPGLGTGKDRVFWFKISLQVCTIESF